jgi:hypothetical protein
MNKPPKELLQIHNRAIEYFYSGILGFVVLKTIREEFQRNQETNDDIFLSTLVFSTYNTIILALANTIKPSPDSVCLHYLFNCIKASKNKFDAETYNHLESFICEFERGLLKISRITDSVIKLRNTTVAYLDRKHVNNPSSLIQNPPIKWDDMERAYDIIGSGLSKIGNFLGFEDIRPYASIANIALAEKTRRINRLLYGTDKVVSLQ